MIDFLDKINIRISVARLQELGPEWRTDNFFPASRIVPLNRLFFPLEGAGEVEYNGRHYRLEKGKMLLIPAFAPVNLRCERRLLKYWSHFNTYILESELDLFALKDECLEVELDEARMSAASALFKRLIPVYDTEKHEMTPLQKFEAESALRLLLVPFLRKLSGEAQPRQMPRLIDLLSYIESHLGQELTLSVLGRQIGLHPNYLSALFKEKMGLPPMVYLNRRRMQRAVHLLRTTDLGIGEITAETGISNVQMFSKMFKRYSGQSPTSFKKQVIAEP